MALLGFYSVAESNIRILFGGILDIRKSFGGIVSIRTSLGGICYTRILLGGTEQYSNTIRWYFKIFEYHSVWGGVGWGVHT